MTRSEVKEELGFYCEDNRYGMKTELRNLLSDLNDLSDAEARFRVEVIKERYWKEWDISLEKEKRRENSNRSSFKSLNVPSDTVKVVGWIAFVVSLFNSWITIIATIALIAFLIAFPAVIKFVVGLIFISFIFEVIFTQGKGYDYDI